MASDIIIPQRTTANKRVGMAAKPPYCTQDRDLKNLLYGYFGWVYDFANGDLYQPLFGLTAKTLDGKEQTVCEGHVVLFRVDGEPILGGDFGVIVWRDYSFMIAWANNEDYPTPVIDVDVLDLTILCHVKDIVDGTIPCWECKNGKKYSPQELVAETGQPPSVWDCPACDGTGRRNVTIAPEGER